MNAHRVNIIGFLQLVADYEAQRKYQDEVPFVGLPYEMCCQWFNDFYHPEFEQFAKVFSIEELEELAKFNAVYDVYADSLPETLTQLQDHKGWLVVSNCAQDILKKFRWENLDLKYDAI